jgi:hypothetical protein
LYPEVVELSKSSLSTRSAYSCLRGQCHLIDLEEALDLELTVECQLAMEVVLEEGVESQTIGPVLEMAMEDSDLGRFEVL